MFGWLRELKDIFRGRECQSCEVLIHQLNLANTEKKELLNKLLEVPPAPVVDSPPVEISRPKVIPWAVRRQMLEAEDREKARLLKNAPVPTEKLEENIGLNEMDKK